MYFCSSLVFFSNASGTVTYSFITAPYTSNNLLLYYFRKASRSSFGSRRAMVSVMADNSENMLPLREV
jgi:hypothetical protein